MTDPLAVLDAWPVPNAAAAVLSADGIVTQRGDLTQRFALASVTKPLAVLGALVAVEEEALGLDDPAITDVVDSATVRHLMSHASGLSPDRRNRAAEPGTRRIYSNIGIDILGETVAAATGMPFPEYLRQAVFAPLGMSGTSVDGLPSRDGVASVADLARLIGELLRPTGWLHSTTLEAATAVQFPGIRGVLPGYGAQDPNDWGLGFEIKGGKAPHWTGPANSPATYGHFGQAGTMFWVDPVRRLGLVALTDRAFDVWAAAAWPELSDAVLAAYPN
ncbi:MAG: serine hydrolase domain-containing protein [Jatrophihabitans sp.]